MTLCFTSPLMWLAVAELLKKDNLKARLSIGSFFLYEDRHPPDELERG